MSLRVNTKMVGSSA